MAADKEAVGLLRVHKIISIYKPCEICPNEIIVYSLLKNTNTTRMHKIS